MAIDYGVWVARLGLAVVFGLSAFGKLGDLSGARKAVGEFGVPLRWVPAVTWVLPMLEASIAVALLPRWTAPWAGALAVLLLMVFTLAVLRLLRQGKRPVCSCFGAVGATPIGPRTLVRNGLMLALAATVTAASIARPRVPAALPVDHTVGLTILAVLAGYLFWLTGELLALRRRLDQQVLSTLGGEGLPVGAVAPEFELLRTGGGRTDLAELLSPGRHLLLVFVHPGCEMCAALARELPRWRSRTSEALTIAVLGNGDVAEHAVWGERQALGDIPVLVQQGNEAALRYRVRGTPSGVLISADGRVAAPVARGAMAVRDLIVQAKRTGLQSNSHGNGQTVPEPR
ncbi:MauE/DoxX family redox-associated membrane protein [Nocardia jejuensis]|uniref:MauE/DoxX family redox-associated membrane protein n=1 Tax=Nocardia jejuensis TaxID=328049 RepID=UPI001471F476|nr:MauE/DoxX family redox-associated membrane protein [Nocardia jejuensis]